MANTAKGIITAATLTSAQSQQTLQLPPSVITLPDSTPSEKSMGSASSKANLPPKQTGTKRRGRPPGSKKLSANANCMGGSAKKHIFSQVQASPARQSATPSRTPGNRSVGAPMQSSLARPSAKMDPQTSSSTPGFRIPGSPLP